VRHVVHLPRISNNSGLHVVIFKLAARQPTHNKFRALCRKKGRSPCVKRLTIWYLWLFKF
jgi:hypothetical protein